MSGTYRLDGVLLTDNPGVKSWRFNDTGRRGGRGINQLSQFLSVDWVFPPLAVGTGTTLAFLAEKYNDGGEHAVVMSHPSTGYLSIFSGVVIADFSYQLTDVDDSGWAQSVKMTIDHISLDNAHLISKQPYWWFGNNRDYAVSLSGSQDAAGEVLTLTVELSNDDKYPLAETVTSIPTPAGLVYSGYVGNGVFDDASDEWTLSALSGGDTASVVITYDVTTPGAFDFLARVDAEPYYNNEPSNDTDEITVYPWWLAEGVAGADVYGAYNAAAATDYADSLVNRNNPGTADLTTGVAPSWGSVYGWGFDGSTTYLVSGKQPTNDMTIVVYLYKSSADFSTDTGYIAGANTLTDEYKAYKIRTSGVGLTEYISKHSTISSTTSDASIATLYSSINGVVSFSSGASNYRRICLLDPNDGSSASCASITAIATSADITRNIYVGANNNEGVADNFFNKYIKAIAIYNTMLTYDQIYAIRSQIKALV